MATCQGELLLPSPLGRFITNIAKYPEAMLTPKRNMMAARIVFDNPGIQ